MLNIHLKSDRGICGIMKRDFGGVVDMELVLLPSERPVVGASVAAERTAK